MADGRESAKPALALLDGASSDEGSRTKVRITHVLDESHSDGSSSKDVFNVPQTAGGLPDTITMDQCIAAITSLLREDLAQSNVDSEMRDDDVRIALLSVDSNIRRPITFLNGGVHHIAPGEVHLALWKRMLDSRSDPHSIYQCYAEYLVDG